MDTIAISEHIDLGRRYVVEAAALGIAAASAYSLMHPVRAAAAVLDENPVRPFRVDFPTWRL
jgi:hypothetical protein